MITDKLSMKKDPAQYRNQQFLSDDYGEHGDDAAKRQASCISHEYLGRVGVVPEKADTGPDKGGDEDHQFTRVGGYTLC